MQNFLPNIASLKGLIVGRVYALQDPDGLTLVDASISNAGGKILAQVQAAGFQPSDVRRILITHAHPDHAGALPALRQATGAEILCHALEKPVIEGEMAVPRAEARLRPPETFLKPTPVTATLADGDILPILGGLQVVHTPGHAPGHLSFWLPELRLCIVGDALFHVLDRLTLPPNFLTADPAQNKRSLQRILDLKPEHLAFGHGRPIIGNAMAELEKFAARIGL